MRVLHLITAATTAEASFTLARAQADAHPCETELVVMAPEDSAVIGWAMDHGIAALRLRPGQPARRLHDAVWVLKPDIVHLHGALSSDQALPLSVFAHLPAVLQLDSADFDEIGALRRQVRGIRLDRSVSDTAWVVCARPTPNGAPVMPSQLPIGITNVVMPDRPRVTSEWFMAIYRRLLATPASTASHLAASPAS
jgi:hypothetical protein